MDTKIHQEDDWGISDRTGDEKARSEAKAAIRKKKWGYARRGEKDKKTTQKQQSAQSREENTGAKMVGADKRRWAMRTAMQKNEREREKPRRKIWKKQLGK